MRTILHAEAPPSGSCFQNMSEPMTRSSDPQRKASRTSAPKPTTYVTTPPGGRRRYSSKPVALGALVDEYFQKHPQQDRIRRGKVLASWAEVVGPHLAARSRGLKFERNRLIVHMPDASWRYELHMNRTQVVARLNEVAGGPVVRELVVRE